jgi:hypothetical protein
MAILQQARNPKAQLLLMLVDPVQKLVDAASTGAPAGPAPH